MCMVLLNCTLCYVCEAGKLAPTYLWHENMLACDARLQIRIITARTNGPIFANDTESFKSSYAGNFYTDFCWYDLLLWKGLVFIITVNIYYIIILMKYYFIL